MERREMNGKGRGRTVGEMGS